jgi:hypothetical protein
VSQFTGLTHPPQRSVLSLAAVGLQAIHFMPLQMRYNPQKSALFCIGLIFIIPEFAVSASI